jgi:DnaJ-class molecular chaperone
MKYSIRRKNYYELLGVSPDATPLEIEIAYSDLSRIYDPDSRFFADIIDEPITEEQREVFEYIKLAYATLMDDERRRTYDESLLEASTPCVTAVEST